MQPVALRLMRSVLDTTFRVAAADGRVYALRLSRADLTTMRSEMAWVTYLHAKGVGVPTVAAAPVEAGGHSCTLVTWLEGRRSLSAATAMQARALGRMLATLHRHACAYEAPAWFHRKTWNPDTMVGEYTPGSIESALEPDDAMLAREWQRRIAALYEPDGLITADFGLHNVLWWRGGPCLFDFNDTGLGMFAYDLALTCESLTRRGVDPGLCVEGYLSEAPLPSAFGDEMRAAVLIRYLLWRARRPGAAGEFDELLARLRALA